MEPVQDSDAKAIWSITWRSILFIPLMLPIALLWLLVMMSIVILPLVGVAYLSFGLWKDAAICFGVWAILFWACRRFHFGKIWEWPPSYL
jgi:hypothetical protein